MFSFVSSISSFNVFVFRNFWFELYCMNVSCVFVGKLFIFIGNGNGNLFVNVNVFVYCCIELIIFVVAFIAYFLILYTSSDVILLFMIGLINFL